MKKYLSIVFALLSIALCILIFLFSSQNGVISSDASGRVTELILRIFIKGWDELSTKERRLMISQWALTVRKCAHFAEYAALGFFFCGLWESMECRAFLGCATRILIPWIFASLYAASDEFHQRFVDGRGPSVRDVALDSLGALAGILLMVLCIAIYRSIRDSRKDK